MTRRLRHILVWIVAFGTLAQSVGAAAGGVLCLGCENLWGVAVASAPCTPVDDCCADRDSHAKGAAPQDQNEGGSDDGCGCIDIMLHPNAGTLAQPPVKIILAFLHFDALPAPIVAAPDVMALRPMWGDRAGPPIVHLLAPSSRQTVLLI
ncbi:MAG: hypothetical protein L0Y44_10480 [Phycisphaerales bacterium]|nr:hypothetical protein [Phycisphaerales bacterium]MCI0631063.1 hypothetical protein [Phycisphaerales bacterium]MCI0674971.1 hypothetical protein [Phycisphaerales bacterium]